MAPNVMWPKTRMVGDTNRQNLQISWSLWEIDGWVYEDSQALIRATKILFCLSLPISSAWVRECHELEVEIHHNSPKKRACNSST